MSNADTLVVFDYAEVPKQHRKNVQALTNKIREKVRGAASHIIEVGGMLLDVKEVLQHGQFLQWLDAEFQWSERTARRMMLVSERFKTANLSDLPIAPSALYLLSSASAKEVKEHIERAEAGETITRAKVLEGREKTAKPPRDAAGRRETPAQEPPTEFNPSQPACPNCGCTDLDEDGDCTQCREPVEPEAAKLSESNEIGQAFEQLDSLVESLLDGKPAWFRVAIKDRLKLLADAL